MMRQAPFLSCMAALALIAATAGPARADTLSAPDFGWLNGTNDQRATPLKTGPLTWTLMVDTYYGYAFNRPADHTVFPTTTAPRHNEFNLNLALLGLEVTEHEHLFGKLLFQAGNYVDTITGTDATTQRGAYSSLAGLRHVQQAYAGHHFAVLSGLNLVMGLFPAYIGLDSYIPQENWNYTHNLLSDFTPYYLSGLMAQLYPRPDLKTELWLVNGWQSLSKHGEGMGVGYSVNARPSDTLSLTHNFLGGNFEPDQTRTRLYTDNTVQWKYATAPWPGMGHLAVAAADAGYNTASTLDYRPSPWMLYRLEYRRDMASIPYVSGPGGLVAPAGASGFSPDLRTGGDRLTANATVRF